MKHIKGLDTLRAFAIFFVLVEHDGVWFDATVPNGRFIKDVIIPDGGFGVHLFFVLSGFLITSILLKQKSEVVGRNSFLVVRNFFVRRTLRIFPIYYLLLFFLYKIDYQCVRHDFAYYVTYMGNLLCYQKNAWTCFSHSWTLAVEEQFYLLWPWFILFVNGKYLKYIFLAAVTIGIVTTFYDMVVTGHIGPFMVYNCFDAFGIGGLLAYVTLNGQYMPVFRKLLKVAVLVSLIGYFYLKIALFMGISEIHVLFLFKTINSVLSVWLILLVINSRSTAINKYFLGNRLLNFIGKVSYGIYLYHYMYNGLYYDKLTNFLDKSTVYFPALNRILRDHHYNYWIQIAAVVFISWMSFVLVEKPILRLKKHFSYNKFNCPTTG